MHLTRASLAKYMDHTLLKPEATAADIDRVVAEARQYGTASVCVNPYWVARVAAGLAGSGVKTCTVIGFPLGATSTASKVAETRDATAHGAQEIDMVINIGELKAGNDDAVRSDISAVANAVQEAGALLKVIIETCLLSDEEKRRACELSVAGGADFVKPRPASPRVGPPQPTSPSCEKPLAQSWASRPPAASARSRQQKL